MGTPAGDDEGDFASAVAALLRAWTRVRAALRDIPDPQRRFDQATELGDLMRTFESQSVEERADAAVAIKEAESLSLTALGERIRMTKQAAGRLADRARRPRKEQ